MPTVSDIMHMARGDKDPVVWCLKVVPRATPNADGVWRKVLVEHKHREPHKYMDSLHKTMWEALCDLVGEDEFVTGIQTDLRFDGKPGNWWPTPNNQEG